MKMMRDGQINAPLSLYLTYGDNIYKVWTVTFNVGEKG